MSDNYMFWKCSLCEVVNHLDSPAGEAELAQCSSPAFEIAATQDYISRLPAPPTYLLVIDVTKDSLNSGFLATICETLHKLVEEQKIPGGERSRIALIAYDKDIHYYCLGKDLQQPAMITSAAKGPIPVPSDKLFLDLEDCQTNLLTLLESLPKTCTEIEPKISVFLHVLEKVKSLMEPRGGKVIFFQAESAIADNVHSCDLVAIRGGAFSVQAVGFYKEIGDVHRPLLRQAWDRAGMQIFHRVLHVHDCQMLQSMATLSR
eukprot:TRINITY_DN6287_c0_g3_i1.p1 TRINITY_DN6287_c0_g3~~TRINITY_DN6287_c0_g3_i1.p1  ORF type:complete len:261 (+),score=-7.92 TRINITY_DN6287_c0_g3_i1:212-994(+)